MFFTLFVANRGRDAKCAKCAISCHTSICILLDKADITQMSCILLSVYLAWPKKMAVLVTQFAQLSGAENAADLTCE